MPEQAGLLIAGGLLLMAIVPGLIRSRMAANRERRLMEQEQKISEHRDN